MNSRFQYQWRSRIVGRRFSMPNKEPYSRMKILIPKKEPHSRMKISRSKKESHSRMKISMLEKEPHGLINKRSFILFVIYWEVRLKPPNIALSLVLHWLPRKGRDRLVFVLWACSCSARRWLDLPGPGFVVIHRPAQMPRVQAPHYMWNSKCKFQIYS